MADDLDRGVRLADPDRWLASRFISDRRARADVIALYAYDHELARASRVTANPHVAQMRLTWWREALDEIFEGRTVRRLPTAQRLAQAIQRHGLARAPLEAMIDARIEVLGKQRLDLEEALLWADTVGGSATTMAARVLDPGASEAAALAAGRVWGLVLLKRAGVVDGPAFRLRLEQSLEEASWATRGLGAVAFPAVVCATLARGDLRATQPSSMGKRLALLWAVVRGRL